MKKMNNKVVLAIELALIIFGLVLSSIGAVRALSDLPGTEEMPEMDMTMEMPMDMSAGGMAPIGNDMFGPEMGPGMGPEMGGMPDFDEMPEGMEMPEGEMPEGMPQEMGMPGSDMMPAEGGMPMMSMDGVMPQGKNTNVSYVIVFIAPVIVYILLAVYVLIEYRKPHGNLLRVTMFVFAIMLAIWSEAQGENVGCAFVLPCAAVIVAFLSGRLNKVKKNIWWIAVATVFLIGFGIVQITKVGTFGLLQFSHCFGVLLQWITLVLAYFSRYEEHKNAGLAVPAVEETAAAAEETPAEAE